MLVLGRARALSNDGVGIRGASHGIEDGGFARHRREVLNAERGPAERLVNGFFRPHERLFEVDFVIGAELGGGLPVLVIETRPAQKVLAHLSTYSWLMLGTSIFKEMRFFSHCK